MGNRVTISRFSSIRALITGAAAALLAIAAPRTLGAQSPEGPAGTMPSDPAVRRALESIQGGLPWRATLQIAPVLADHTRVSDAAVLVAARAASEWGGWHEVERLLAARSWEDTAAEGYASELLARAALADSRTAPAIQRAERAVANATPGREKGVRLVTLARAYENAGRYQEAHDAYLDAGRSLPEIADWLVLRSAALTPDPRERAVILGEITSPAAVRRVGLTDARARLRWGDSANAALVYHAIGWPATAFEIRLNLARTRADSLALRDSILEFIKSHPDHQEISLALTLVTRSFRPLTPETELTIAQIAYTRRLWGAAQAAFQRALADGVGSDQDRFAYATTLAELGMDGPAAKAFGTVEVPRTLAADAAYQRARMRLRVGSPGVRTALRRILVDYPDEPAAMLARVLLADLAIDEGRDADAREALITGARRLPDSPFAPQGRYQAAMIAYAGRHYRTAAAEFDSIPLLYPEHREANGARYWAGRAWDQAGNHTQALERWQTVLDSSPTGYYGILSAKRLGLPPPSLPAPDKRPIPPDSARYAIQRARILEHVGLRDEADFELSALADAAGDSIPAILGTAEAFRRAGYAARSIRLTARALQLGAPLDSATAHLFYPVLRRAGLVEVSEERGLEPALVAALIRQESNFDPEATSGAGARGLMQVLPSVGARVARQYRYPVWDPVLLYQPDVSLEVGTTHLSALVNRYPETVQVLAAYNAGGSRVRRWLGRAGATDPELFVERIPFRETRDYVRIVFRNREMYRQLLDENASSTSSFSE